MSKRIERVNVLIKKELGNIFLKEIDFPEGALVTVTRAETPADLEGCNVFVSVMPEKKFDEVFAILNKRIYFLQQKLNQRLRMRPIPRIRFSREELTSEAGKIEEILERLKRGKPSLSPSSRKTGLGN